MPSVDAIKYGISACEMEPIRSPGAIQPRGSRFLFRICAEIAGSAEAIRYAAASTVVAADAEELPAQLSGRVLVIEDNPTNRKVIQALVEGLGVGVVVAEDGQQGVEAIVGGIQADLILMDVQMPVMDGYAAAARIRQWETDQKQPRRPIIALTANAFAEDKQRCLDAGMDDFLAKPIAMDKLKSILGRWLATRPRVAPTAPAAGEIAEAGYPIFHERALPKQVGDDRELAMAVVQSAVIDIASNLDWLDKTIVSSDWINLKRITYTLKGLAGQMGEMRFTQRIKTAEIQLQDGTTSAGSVVRGVHAEYKALAESIAAWLRQ
jgi:CheY-like chemotaxis protein